MKKYHWSGTNKTLLAIFAATAVVFPLNASLTFSDDFGSVNQPDQIAGSSGGTGWNGSQWYNNNGHNVYVNNNTPLSYSGLQTSGHEVQAYNQNQGIFRY